MMRGGLLKGVHWRRGIDGDTVSPWVPAIAQGADDGLFGPESAVWAVHGSLPTLIGGIRALLIQALHPGPLTGVQEHSRYREDAAGRLERTTQWIATTTFGDRATAHASAEAIQHLHRSVTGTFIDAHGAPRTYSANDPNLARWVHDALTLGFLGAHEIWGSPIPGGADSYVAEWATAGELMGVSAPPRSRAELDAEIHDFLPDLIDDDRVAEIMRFLRRPRLPLGMRLVYPVLFSGAVASLPDDLRTLTGLQRPRWPALIACRVLLTVIGILLGRHSPSWRAAQERARRLRTA